ncbi:MAG: hypothetical protein HYS38_00145 [Acidobacteria bacterium]|nr:hypothetical protein [Acidobacteriota bacterium]
MTLKIRRIDAVEVRLAGKVLFRVQSGAPEIVDTFNVNSEPAQNAIALKARAGPSIIEAVRRTVNEYEETLRRLSDE